MISRCQGKFCYISATQWSWIHQTVRTGSGKPVRAGSGKPVKTGSGKPVRTGLGKPLKQD